MLPTAPHPRIIRHDPASSVRGLRSVVMSAILAGMGAAGAMGLSGCSREDINQDSPEATILAARQLVETQQAEKLPKLIYAESDDLRKLYNTLGRMLGHAEELAVELQKRFPEDMKELATRAEQQAKEGKPTTLLGQIARQAQRSNPIGGNRRRQGPPSPADRQAFNDALTRFFADPYAFLRESEGRLTTVPMTDDLVALQWDKKMILPPIGMVMQRGEDGKWYFVLPTSMGGVRDFMPKTKEQFEIAGGLVAVLDKVVVDLRDEVRGGQLTTLESVSRRAGEMTFLPAVLTFYAYTKLRDEQRKAEAAATAPTQAATTSPAPGGN